MLYLNYEIAFPPNSYTHCTRPGPKYGVVSTSFNSPSRPKPGLRPQLVFRSVSELESTYLLNGYRMSREERNFDVQSAEQTAC